jgi:uncharacterized protein with FMN-binding domain
MAGLARRLAPAAALGGLAIVIVGVADPAIAGRGDAAATGTTATSSGSSGSSGVAAAESPAAAESCDTADAVTGPSVQTRWGPVQVAATIANGELCEVHATAWPDGDNRSAMISQYAIPELDAMASQQGVAFDAISGATYTSEAYRESLQQLLDSL